MELAHRALWRGTAIVLKVALAALLALALVFPEWDRFADKAMDTRAIAYPLAVLLVPAIWLVRHRLGRTGPFPWDVDALLTAPFVVDVGGNALDLYDTVSWFDDTCHFGNWALLGAAAGAALLRGPALPRWTVVLLVGGIGAATAILWEVAEYGAFILDTPETVGIYRDTLGDEILGLLGATTAGLLTAFRFPRPSGTPAPERETSGREASERKAPGQDAVGQSALGQDAAGQDAAGQDAPGQDTAEQDAPGLKPLGQDASRQRIPRQGAPIASS